MTVTDANNVTASNTFSNNHQQRLKHHLGAIASKTPTTGHPALTFTPVPLMVVGTISYGISPALANGLSHKHRDRCDHRYDGDGHLKSATTYTVTVTDSATPTAHTSEQKTFSLTINGLTATQTLRHKLQTTDDTANFTPVTGSGGLTYTYSISPALANGLSLNTSTGG